MDDRVLILAPRGRDSAIAADLLGRNDIVAFVCHDQAELLVELTRGAAAVMLTEEALVTEEVAPLAEWVSAQPNWADIQFVVLANGTRTPRTARATQRLADLGNVLLLERPLHAEAMLGAIRSALTARRRQYELRDVAVTLERAVLDRTSELRTARESLEIVLEAAGMGSWDIDLTTGESRRTLRHDAIYGYPEGKADWNLETFLSHIDVKQRGIVTRAMTEATKTGVIDVEYRIDAADGESRWLVAKGRVQYDDAGKAARMTGVVSDVTDRKEADAQLAQAQKMDAIGQLTGGVAHDFNNLLTVIRSATDLLKRPDLSPERRERYVEAISDTADRAAKLTGQLLAFARRQALQPEVIDIGQSLRVIADMLGTLTGSRIVVAIDLPETPCFASVDPSQLDTALVNMAVNARDAMDGAGRIDIAVRPASFIPPVRSHPAVEGRYVAIAMTDTGSGIAADKLERIFEPFFTTKGVGQGTGLGLSQVFGFAKQSGGDIIVDSELGRGTTFTLYLPRVDERVATAGDDVLETLADGHGTCVLVVEDNSEVGTFTTQSLAELGYVTVWAADAQEALAELARDAARFDIVFSDVVMPGMNGIELGKVIRSKYPDLPVVLTSGYSSVLAQDGTHGFELLHKPYSVEQLSRVLRKVAG